MKTALGVGLWEFMAQNTETSNMFNVAMASDSRILMEVLVNECGGGGQRLCGGGALNRRSKTLLFYRLEIILVSFFVLGLLHSGL